MSYADKMDESTKAKRRRSARVSNRAVAANLVALGGRKKNKNLSCIIF